MSIVKLCFIFFIGMSFYACNIAAGSYPYVEKYEINKSEKSIIEKIKKIKTDSIQFNPPAEMGLIDGRTDSLDHWYHVYFFIQVENQVYYFWTRPINNNSTTVGFVAVNNGITLGHWKYINKDFTSEENEKVKKEFEQKIFSQIQRP